VSLPGFSASASLVTPRTPYAGINKPASQNGEVTPAGRGIPIETPLEASRTWCAFGFYDLDDGVCYYYGTGRCSAGSRF
jgi:hypothetical protein